MSTYPGNTSLSDAVKERVTSTFQQALTLYKQGRSDEAVQGCGLILRMDPLFEPAKKLMDKVRNPSSTVNVDALTATTPGGDPMTQARAAMASRNFQMVVDITTEILTNDLMNDEARMLNEQAREKLEAAPFVDQFVKKAEQAIASGDAAGARAVLEKIRSLDGDDTAIARVEQAIGNIKSTQPSFVVDGPQQKSARGTAQASDFGFTFEEEKGQPQSTFNAFSFEPSAPAAPSTPSPFSTDTGTQPSVTPPGGYSFDSAASSSGPFAPVTPPAGFSFDTPPPGPSPFGGAGFSFDTPVTPPASGEFDFTTAPTETTPDDQKKIQQYLAEGDRALEAGNHQQAIDLWSRIFLIDVTNDQASDRIERAKAGRRNSEHLIEANLAAGVQAFDRKDFKTAQEKFNQVLQADPPHGPAKDYLRQINEVPAEGGATAFETPFTPEPTPSRDIFSDDASSGGSLVPPSPTSAAPAPAPTPTRKAAPKAAPKAAATPQRELPIRAIVIVVGVLILGAAGWFVWTKFMSKPAFNPAATDAIFAQAASLGERKQYDAAIAVLQDVKPADPQHDKALSMIADLQKKKGQAAETVDGRPAAAVYQEGLAAGKAAYDARDYEAAKKAFDSAARVKPLPPDMKALYDAASQQTGKLEGAKTLFKEQRYQDALTSLQGLQQQDPSNQSIKRMISDAHFNLGAIALQEERLPDAIKEFDEVIKIDSSDDLAKRSKALAERYNGQRKDLLYKIFVKYLPMRKVT